MLAISGNILEARVPLLGRSRPNCNTVCAWWHIQLRTENKPIWLSRLAANRFITLRVAEKKELACFGKNFCLLRLQVEEQEDVCVHNYCYQTVCEKCAHHTTSRQLLFSPNKPSCIITLRVLTVLC